jgi:hypothetical protein
MSRINSATQFLQYLVHVSNKNRHSLILNRIFRIGSLDQPQAPNIELAGIEVGKACLLTPTEN